MGGVRGVRRGADRAPEEEVVGIGRPAAVLEQPQQIGKLPVDVTDNLERSFELQQCRLRGHDRRRILDYRVDLVGAEGDGGTGFFWQFGI